MIKVESLHKSYGAIQALKGIDFSVSEGEVVGLLGPNGAGKSTAIKILTGYLHPDEGIVEIDGENVLHHTQSVQSKIGYLPENTPLYPSLSVQNYLKLMADMRGISADEQKGLISEAVRATQMQDYLARSISKLSKGLRQRVGLAQAILHKPKLLILDEPTVGLDPTQIVEIRNLILRLADTTTILFSSHILSEVEAVCDRVIIIINGEVKADEWLDELSEGADAILVLDDSRDTVEQDLKTLDGISGVVAYRQHDGYPAYRIQGGGERTSAIYALAVDKGWPLRELHRDVQTLENVFNDLATAV